MPGSDDLLKKKLKIFNLKRFVNSKQKEAVNAVLKRDHDVFVSMGAGNRKSIAFQLPGIMQENKITIVCSASDSSIKDQIHYLKKSKISAVSITSKLNDDERQRIHKDVTNDKPKTRFIYVKPEVASTEFFSDILRTLSTNDKLAYFAVDDAHLASPRVQDFCQDYLKFGSLRPAYPSVPWITLTHNASVDVRNDIVKNLQLREPVANFTKSTFRKNLHHDIVFKIVMIDLFAHLRNFLTTRLHTDDEATKSAGIIFCKNRETVDMVVGKLTEIGFHTKAHHGGMKSSEKKKVEDEWLSGTLPVITATNSFGSGIDKSAVRVVVHFDVPHSIAGFYKETGLAGRDGKLSYSRIYYCKSDVAEVDGTLKAAIDKSKDENAKRKALRAHADFLKMSDLCETVDCRHKIFSNYFDDTEPACKDKCDVCANPQEANVALGLFHQFSAPSTRDNDDPNVATFTPVIIKTEPHHPANGQSSELGTLNPIRARSISPTNTIVKEENTTTDNETNLTKSSDELLAMKVQPPRDISPARTIIKEEPVTKIKQEVDNVGVSSRPSRCVSPVEATIDQKPFQSTTASVPQVTDQTAVLSDELFGMKTLPPRDVSPARTVVKEEGDVELNETESHSVKTTIDQKPFHSTTVSQFADHSTLLSDELFTMKTLPPRDVSPARTVVKEEGDVELNETESHSVEATIDQKPFHSTTVPQFADQSAVLSDELFTMKTLPPRDVSPARTVVKREANDEPSTNEPHSENHAGDSVDSATNQTAVLSDELFRMKTLPPRDVSPARTVVKEEGDVEPNETEPHVENHAVDSTQALSEDSKVGIRLLSPRRCASPAETIVDEKPFVNTTNGHGLASTVATNAAQAAPEYSSAVIIKSEPKSPVRPMEESDRVDLNVDSHATSDIGSVIQVVKREPADTQPTDEGNRNISERESRSPSPTGTIVKDECLSPASSIDFDGEALEYIGDGVLDDEDTPKVFKVDSERSKNRNQNAGTDKVQTKPQAMTSLPAQSLEMIRDSSSEPEFVSSKNRERSIRDRSDSSRRRTRKRSRSRSRSVDRIKRENDRRRRSRSRDRMKREKNIRRRSRSTSLSSRRSSSQSVSRRRSRSRSRERSYRRKGRSRRSRTRSRSIERFKRERNGRRRSSSRSVSSRRSRSNELVKRESDRRRRSRSKERVKREKSGNRKPSSSPSGKRSQAERTSKRRRHSSDSDTDPNYSTPTPSTSTKSNRRLDSKWPDRRFSVSPEVTNRRTECEENGNDRDDDTIDYGWEDAAPPKLKLEKQTNSVENEVIQQKMKEFNSKLSNEYDLDKIHESYNELHRVIRETIDLTTKKKLSDLDGKIQQKRNAFVTNLFGTDNFDSWDDDPALSNVTNAKKLQSFKALVPDGLPLYEKMIMKYEMNAMRLQPTRVGNELVFQGNIKAIEKEFQGQELPLPLMEAIKQEKEVICEMVRKYLMPYYNNKRIQTAKLFADVARKISHHFYGHAADENTIRQYVDDMFAKCGKITASTELA